MPRRIVTADGISFRYLDYELSALAEDEVRVQVEFATPKHGTEGQIIGGSVFDEMTFDKEMRIFLPRPATTAEDASTQKPERGIGNVIVGTVIEIGAKTTRFKPGDKVFGPGSIREVHTGKEEMLRPLQGLSSVDAACTEPAHVAFVAVRDGNIRVGDDVAIYGLGAIGLLTIQVAKAGGARRVFAVDPIPSRRDAAKSMGATDTFDPLNQDAALEIKLATERKGVDVAIETSGNDRALNDAIRAIRQCGKVVHVPWGPKSGANLHLDREFHINRPVIIGSQAWSGWGNPDRDHPLWDPERAYQAAIDLFRDGKLTGQSIVTPIVPFDDCFEALATILTAPDRSIKVGVQF